MPDGFELAVELYVKPMDLPLIQKGNEVLFIFDGWPAFVFSGWPDQSFGTFSGEVFAIDNEIGESGKFRIMVRDKDNYKDWPSLRNNDTIHSHIMPYTLSVDGCIGKLL